MIKTPKNIAVVYSYIAHYRIPIFNILSSSKENYYTIFAGTIADVPIKLADVSLASINVEEGGIRWRTLRNIWILKYFLWQPNVMRLCFSREFDTIIFLGNMYYLSTWVGAIIAKFRRKKVVFWTHGFIREEKNLQGSVRSLFYKLADEVLTYGQRAKNIMVSKGFNPDKIHLIYNSLDYSNQLSIREECCKLYPNKLFDDENLPTFGFIGRLTKQKRIHLLIDALEKMHSSGIKVNLLIVGDGKIKAELKDMSVAYGLSDYICFYGACYDERTIFQLLKRMKVVVSPGEVGLTAIHSMTYGVPVITHNRFDKQMPEFECITPGVTGDFYDYDNPLLSMVQLLKFWLSRADVENVTKDCQDIISKYYNPFMQLQIFNSIV